MSEKRSWVDTGLEVSKKIDIAGMVVGLGMMAFGIAGGIWLAGGSGASYIVTNEIQTRRKNKHAHFSPQPA